jgi:hypothetical protein
VVAAAGEEGAYRPERLPLPRSNRRRRSSQRKSTTRQRGSPVHRPCRERRALVATPAPGVRVRRCCKTRPRLCRRHRRPPPLPQPPRAASRNLPFVEISNYLVPADSRTSADLRTCLVRAKTPSSVQRRARAPAPARVAIAAMAVEGSAEAAVSAVAGGAVAVAVAVAPVDVAAVVVNELTFFLDHTLKKG